jgi:hypothetical protein
LIIGNGGSIKNLTNKIVRIRPFMKLRTKKEGTELNWHTLSP